MKRVPFIVLFAVASVLACGPFINDILPVETVRPGDLNGYAYRGEIGVVRPHFARRYLVQAYRRMTGRNALRAVGRLLPAFDLTAQESMQKWSEVHSRIAGTPPELGRDRTIGEYQSIVNCLGAAYAAAAQTLSERAARYGAASRQVREWIDAQGKVFRNCSEQTLVVPEPLPATADPLARADRQYQIAAAYFYGMRYDEAVQRFRQIASDQTSPWRPYGHYLAGRARLRQATTAQALDRARLSEAEAEFRLVLGDVNAAFLHGSARGLLNRVALRANPAGRLRTLSAMLSSESDVDDQALRDYEYLMDAALGDTTSYEYDTVPDRAALAATADLNDWILVMQGTDGAADDRALTRWKQTGSVPWLAAALWKVSAANPEAPALLQAAARLDNTSPAFFTIAFLRVRLLSLRGANDEARAMLSTLPTRSRRSGGPIDDETLNLLNALRFKLARSMDELLITAPRHPIGNREGGWNIAEDGRYDVHFDEPIFDDDAGTVFSERLPLSRLVEAAASTALPARLRLRVASAAFTRAWMLKRDDEAKTVARVLRTLSPSLAADLRKLESAGTAQESHLAGVRLLLRTPGLRANVKGIEDDEDAAHKELSREFDHVFRRNWWCGLGERALDSSDASQVVQMIYPNGEVELPAFLSKDEIAAMQREWAALGALGPAPNYLAAEAVKWANARPSDLDAAEALAHAVEGTRWGCTDGATTAASRSAFQTLHRLFPKSEWARRTKYWY